MGELNGKYDRGAKAFVGLGILFFCLWLAFWGTVIFAAVHFIAKLW